MIRVAIRLRKARSWVTNITVVGQPRSSPSSHSILARSRWLVGSSSSRRSGRPTRAWASQARRLRPTESSASGVSLPRGSPSSWVAASSRVISWSSRQASSTGPRQPSRTNSPTVTVAGTLFGGSWAWSATFAPGARRKPPRSGSISPARILRSVLLPVPLRPSSPIRSPGSTTVETPSSSSGPRNPMESDSSETSGMAGNQDGRDGTRRFRSLPDDSVVGRNLRPGRQPVRGRGGRGYW